eukprot:TRINITY_DN21610_c0_g1_i1.p1 TRINITY_DN21610_c0_g1~~TRINITY_DN21610_c0_g1_i1.p1  ORF type:complete len:292 (+),score=63.82 TRINITY_DN21610_c0_g1_i1:74-949(+)
MTTRRPVPMNDFHRQNRMQIKEQEMLNREMRKRDQQTKERDEKMKERLRGQYSRKGSLTATRGAAAAATAARTHNSSVNHRNGGNGYHMEETSIDAVPRSGEIQVFIRETEPAHARQFTIKEDSVYSAPAQPSPPPQEIPEEEPSQPIAPSNAVAMCGPPSGGSGAARKNSSAGRTMKATPGKVPAYLEQRKAEIQYEKDLLNQALEEDRRRKQHPPGCKPLTHDEKTEILKALEAKKKDLLSDINRLPMRYDTTSIRKRREDLEHQIRDVESKIGQYSRKVVYVPEEAAV